MHCERIWHTREHQIGCVKYVKWWSHCHVIVYCTLGYCGFMWFCGFTDSLYTRYFNLFVSINDSLPTHWSYYGAGICKTSYHSVPSSGVSVANCTSGRYSSYLMTVVRYVTVMPHPHNWGSIWTICEVTVTGVRQHIDADGIAWLLAV